MSGGQGTEELHMKAYTIKRSAEGRKQKVPFDFLKSIELVPFRQRWDNSLERGNYCRNIVSFELADPDETYGKKIFVGTLVQIHCLQTVDILSKDGEEDSILVPEETGAISEKSYWNIAICPDENLCVIEQKGHSPEGKLQNFLRKHSQNWNRERDQQIDEIYIQPIPQEDDPVNYLRHHPSLGSFEARLDAENFQKQEYGLLSGLFSGLNPKDQGLTVEVSIKASKRGGELPEIMSSKLADFLSSVEGDIKTASVREMEGGRKKTKPTKLLDAMVAKSVHIEPGEPKIVQLIDFMLETIETVSGATTDE